MAVIETKYSMGDRVIDLSSNLAGTVVGFQIFKFKRKNFSFMNIETYYVDIAESDDITTTYMRRPRELRKIANE